MSDRLYAIEVGSGDGKMLVGPWYADKSVASSWVPFVKANWHGIPTRVRSFSRKRAEQIQANGGQMIIQNRAPTIDQEGK